MAEDKHKFELWAMERKLLKKKLKIMTELGELRTFTFHFFSKFMPIIFFIYKYFKSKHTHIARNIIILLKGKKNLDDKPLVSKVA